jgi:hypothetical protein
VKRYFCTLFYVCRTNQIAAVTEYSADAERRRLGGKEVWQYIRDLQHGK